MGRRFEPFLRTLRGFGTNPFLGSFQGGTLVAGIGISMYAGDSGPTPSCEGFVVERERIALWAFLKAIDRLGNSGEENDDGDDDDDNIDDGEMAHLVRCRALRPDILF